MGANLFALTWLAIDNFIRLDISAKNYQRGAYALCNLLPTQRRKQPIKKQIEQFSQCNSAVSPSVTGGFVALSHSETEKTFSSTLTVSVSENNVFIPLPLPNSIERIVGVKGKSGIAKHQTVATN